MCPFIEGWGIGWTYPVLHAFFVFCIHLVQIDQILHTCLQMNVRRIKWRLNKTETFILGAF